MPWPTLKAIFAERCPANRQPAFELLETGAILTPPVIQPQQAAREELYRKVLYREQQAKPQQTRVARSGSGVWRYGSKSPRKRAFQYAPSRQ